MHVPTKQSPSTPKVKAYLIVHTINVAVTCILPESKLFSQF